MDDASRRSRSSIASRSCLACAWLVHRPPLATFSSCLVAEAVGQLAAWPRWRTARSRAAGRGTAHETRFLRDVALGAVLDLAVEIDSCDDEAVAYHGWAEVAGARVIELNDCLGPMLPVADFDAPEALAARFLLLRGEGAPPGRFRGIEDPRVVQQRFEAGESATALLYVPRGAVLRDHFAAPGVPRDAAERADPAGARRCPCGSHWPAGTALRCCA
jgi:hypothetical protein